MTATLTSTPSTAKGSLCMDWSTYGRRNVGDMSQNSLIAERDRLRALAETGEITGAQAARLREIDDTLEQIRRATRGW